MSTNSQETDILFPDGMSIRIGLEEFKVKPFVLKQRTQVVKIFAEIFSELAKNGDLANTNNVAVITKFIEQAGDRIIDLYEIILGKDREWLNNNLTLKQEIMLIQAVMEMNDFPFLVSQVQKMMAMKK